MSIGFFEYNKIFTRHFFPAQKEATDTSTYSTKDFIHLVSV